MSGPTDIPSDESDKDKALDSLEAFLSQSGDGGTKGSLELPEGLPEALDKDLEVSGVLAGFRNDKALKHVLDNGTDDNVGLKAFEQVWVKFLEHKDNFSNQELEYVENYVNEQLTRLARKDFYSYVRLMAPQFIPDGFIEGNHIKVFAREFQQVEQQTAKGAPKRLQISCPPGGMKSILVNLFVSWVLGRHPTWRILHVGHGTQFVEDNAGRPIRDLMFTEEYRKVFPGTNLKKDSRAAGRWDTEQGGKYFAAGAGAQIAGRRAHIAICDDVMSEQTAYSITERRKINAWYVPGLRSRLLPKGSEINIQTRWHVEDLAGFLTNNDSKSKRPWRVIRIPAILDAESAKLLKLPVGGSFWPEFQPLDFLEERKNDPALAGSKWSALYMQEPIPEEGNIIGEGDFQYWKNPNPPDLDFVIVSLDTAFSQKASADFSAYSVWGVFLKKITDMKGKEMWQKHLILLEARRGKWILSELATVVDDVYKFYKPDIVLVEEESSGRSLVPELQNRGYPCIGFSPRQYGDKAERLNACSPFFKSGRIWVPDSQEFTHDLVSETSQVPHAPHDDLCDTMTQAILYMRDSFGLSHSAYESEQEDEDSGPRKKRKTYWSQAAA